MQAVSAASLPAFESAWPRLRREFGDAAVALMVDFDGTLVPRTPAGTASRYDAPATSVLSRIAAMAPVAIVTGRDVQDIRSRLKIPGAYYAGCHGCQLDGPGLSESASAEEQANIRAVATAVEAAVARWPRAVVQAKRFAVSVHYGAVAPGEQAALIRSTQHAAAQVEGIAVTRGQELVELRPDGPHDKGTAVLRLLDHLDAARGTRHAVLVLGDDETDEDAFVAAASRPQSASVVVGCPDRPTRAGYRLDDVPAVHRWLATWCETLRA